MVINDSALETAPLTWWLLCESCLGGSKLITDTVPPRRARFCNCRVMKLCVWKSLCVMGILVLCVVVYSINVFSIFQLNLAFFVSGSTSIFFFFYIAPVLSMCNVFLAIIPQTIQSSNCWNDVYLVFSIMSQLEKVLIMQKVVHRLHAYSVLFYVNDLSILRFWYPWTSSNKSLLGNEERSFSSFVPSPFPCCFGYKLSHLSNPFPLQNESRFSKNFLVFHSFSFCF